MTAVPGVAEISIDQRALDPDILAVMHREAQEASRVLQRRTACRSSGGRCLGSSRVPLIPHLLELCEASVVRSLEMRRSFQSGPLHDAAEMGPHMPVVMMFAHSARDSRTCKEEGHARRASRKGN